MCSLSFYFMRSLWGGRERKRVYGEGGKKRGQTDCHRASGIYEFFRSRPRYLQPAVAICRPHLPTPISIILPRNYPIYLILGYNFS